MSQPACVVYMASCFSTLARMHRVRASWSSGQPWKGTTTLISRLQYLKPWEIPHWGIIFPPHHHSITRLYHHSITHLNHLSIAHLPLPISAQEYFQISIMFSNIIHATAVLTVMFLQAANAGSE